MITATNIETSVWNSMIESLISQGWRMTYKYDNFDAGIAADFVILEKEDEEILFGWDNWFEGEIQCTEYRMKEIEKVSRIEFKKGQPTNLKPVVVELNMRWKKENKWHNSR